MKILLLQISLIPHRIWLVLFAVATAVDNGWLWLRGLWLREKRRRKEPVYGSMRDPRGGNYFDAPDDA